MAVSVFPPGFGTSSASESLREDLISEAFNSQGRVYEEGKVDGNAKTFTSYNEQSLGKSVEDLTSSDLAESVSPMPLKVKPVANASVAVESVEVSSSDVHVLQS